MLDRRSLLKSLSALPFLGFLADPVKRLTVVSRMERLKSGSIAVYKRNWTVEESTGGWGAVHLKDPSPEWVEYLS